MEKSQLSVVVILTGVESEPEVSGVVLLQAQRPSTITPAIISAASDFSFINQTVLSFFVYITPRSVYTYFKSSGKRAKAVWYRGFEISSDPHSIDGFRSVSRFASHEFRPQDKAPRQSHG